MTVREMHIEIEQSLNKVGAARTRKYLAEEKDWIMNKMQTRFIQSRIKPKADGTGGFELDQISADQIRTLIVSSYDLVPYIDDSKRYKCFLPHDYSYLLSDWSYTTLLCGTTPTVTTDNKVLYYLRQEKSTKISAPFYETIDIGIANQEFVLPDDLSINSDWLGLNKVDNIQFLFRMLALKLEAHWEKLGDQYMQDCYLRLEDYDNLGAIQTIDGVELLDNAGVTDIAFTRHAGEGKFFDNRLVGSNKVSGLTATPFWNTLRRSPISELTDTILYVYRDESFTVNKVGISYIRKPLPISLSLGINSELPEEFHQTLCDLTIEYILKRIGSPGQQEAGVDLDKRVVL